MGVLFSICSIAHAIDVPQEIVSALKQGNADLISNYFDNTVELTIDTKENIYSSKQATIILKDFFKRNSPNDFSVVHEGGKGESKYVIGNLSTNQGKFRITILLKNNSKTYINQLRIEKDEV